jgi:hypothetical protein
MKLLGTLKLPGVFRHIRFGWLAGILVVIGIAVGLSAHGATDPGQTLWRDPAADPVSDPALTVAALPSLSGLVKKLEPAVVNIQTTQVVKTGGQFFQLGPGTQIPGLEDFFRKQNPFGGPEPKFAPPGGRFKRSAQGSGFIINADGYIIPRPISPCSKWSRRTSCRWSRWVIRISWRWATGWWPSAIRSAWDTR